MDCRSEKVKHEWRLVTAELVVASLSVAWVVLSLTPVPALAYERWGAEGLLTFLGIGTLLWVLSMGIVIKDIVCKFKDMGK